MFWKKKKKDESKYGSHDMSVDVDAWNSDEGEIIRVYSTPMPKFREELTDESPPKQQTETPRQEFKPWQKPKPAPEAAPQLKSEPKLEAVREPVRTAPNPIVYEKSVEPLTEETDAGETAEEYEENSERDEVWLDSQKLVTRLDAIETRMAGMEAVLEKIAGVLGSIEKRSAGLQTLAGGMSKLGVLPGEMIRKMEAADVRAASVEAGLGRLIGLLSALEKRSAGLAEIPGGLERIIGLLGNLAETGVSHSGGGRKPKPKKAVRKQKDIFDTFIDEADEEGDIE